MVLLKSQRVFASSGHSRFGPQLRLVAATSLKVMRLVTGDLNPRIDGAACAGEDKGAVKAPGLFNGMAIQSDGLSVASSVR